MPNRNVLLEVETHAVFRLTILLSAVKIDTIIPVFNQEYRYESMWGVEVYIPTLFITAQD